MADFARRNWRLRLLAFILALSVWLYFRLSSGALGLRPAELRLTVPITVKDVAPGLRAFVQPREITITVNGAAHRDGAPHAYVSALSRGSGSYRLPIVIQSDDAVLSVTPGNVIIVIEKETP